MPLIVPVRLPGGALKQTVAQFLGSTAPEKQTVNTNLNTVLKSQLISSATSAELTDVANLLQNLAPGDLATDQSLSVRDFVAKHVAPPVNSAALMKLSSKTTVGALLGLNGTVASNPLLRGIVAQTNLASLLSTSPALSTAQQQADFIAKYAAFQGSTQEFWAQLSQDSEFKTAVPDLQLTMQLGVLTLNNSALVSALRTTYKPASLRDLTKLDAPTLSQLLTSQKLAVPTAIPGSTPAEQLTNYTNGIVGLLVAAFPTDYMAKGLATSQDATLQLVARVLSDSPDIDLHSTKIDAYLKQNAIKAFQNVPSEQVAAVTARIKSVQRVFRISPDSSTGAALLAAGLDSASNGACQAL